MQGQEVYKSKTQDFCLDDVPAHGVLIVKQVEGTKRSVYLRESPKMGEEPRIEIVR